MVITASADETLDADSARPARRWVGWLAAAAPFVIVLAPLIAAAARIIAIDDNIALWGDQALIGLGAREALRGDHLLGVYSRLGWHHPGPAWLMAVGVFSAIGGGNGTAVVIASMAVHAVAAVAIVAVARVLAGAAGAWFAALVVLAVMQTLGIAERLTLPWNPWATVVPMLLFVMLCLATSDHRRPLLPWAAAVAVCGSFLVQTHVGTGPVIVALPAVALGVRFLARRMESKVTRDPSPVRVSDPRTSRVVLALAAVALVVMWVPPIIEQLTGDPGNVTRLLQDPPARSEPPGPGAAALAVGNELAAFPFWKDTPRPHSQSDPSIYDGREHLRFLPVGYVILAGGIALLAWRRRRFDILSLAALGGVGVAVAVVAASLADPPLFPYLIAWAMVFPAVIWTAVVALVADVVASRRAVGQRWVVSVLAVVAVVVSAACVSQALRNQQVQDLAGFAGGQESWDAVRAAIPDSERPVMVDLSTAGAMPVAAAVVDQLDRRGQPWSVEEDWEYFFGSVDELPDDAEPIELYFARIEDNVPAPPNSTELGFVTNTYIYMLDD